VFVSVICVMLAEFFRFWWCRSCFLVFCSSAASLYLCCCN